MEEKEQYCANYERDNAEESSESWLVRETNKLLRDFNNESISVFLAGQRLKITPNPIGTLDFLEFGKNVVELIKEEPNYFELGKKLKQLYNGR